VTRPGNEQAREQGELIREALLSMGPRPTPLPESAPSYMRRDNAKLIAGWDALDSLLAELERLRGMLGSLYAAYCLATKPGVKEMPDWFVEIIHELFPETLTSIAAGKETDG